MSKRFWLVAVAILLCAGQAYASEVVVSGAWVRASASGQDSAAVSLHITSQKDARLIAVSSPVSNDAAIHAMKHENGMMMMRPIDALPLPAKHEVALGEGDHIMLIGLKKPLKVGDTVPLTLTVEFVDKRKEKVSVKVEVKSLTESQGMKDMPGMR
jgi:copper(I)-binding protein